MALEIQPSLRGALVALAIVLTLAIWVYTSGAILTLVVLAVGIGVLLYLLYIGGWRLTRRLLGV